MTNKSIIRLGAFASILYFIAVILGGLLWPGYSHVRQAISELTMASAPNQVIIQPLFILYNLALLTFAVGVFHLDKNKSLQISAVFLFLVALSGLLMYFFPQDPINSDLSLKGFVHFILAGAAAIGTIIAIFLGGLGLQQNAKFKKISLFLGSIVVVSGGLTPVAMAKMGNYFGIFERVTIFSFVIWLFLFSEVLILELKNK